jgi:hypothetical protein
MVAVFAVSAWVSIPLPAAAVTQPDEIDNLGLWLSAGDLAAGHRDSQVVTLWPDRSGKGHDAIYEGRIPQTSMRTGLHNPPTFKLNALGGQPAVAFDAANRESLILNRAGHALGQQTSGFTAIFLVRPTLVYGAAPTPDSSWRKNRFLFLTHVSDYNTRISVQIVAGSGEVKLFTRPVPAQERVTKHSSFAAGEQHALRGDTWHRLMVTVDYKEKVARIVMDGKVLTSALPADSANAFEDVPSPITGIASTTLGDWLTCQLAEMICYQRALTVEELQSLDNYLLDKYRM